MSIARGADELGQCLDRPDPDPSETVETSGLRLDKRQRADELAARLPAPPKKPTASFPSGTLGPVSV
jgi:hypothetical protein